MRPYKSVDAFVNRLERKVQSLQISRLSPTKPKKILKNKTKQSPKKTPEKLKKNTQNNEIKLDSTFLSSEKKAKLSKLCENSALEQKVTNLAYKLKKAKNVIRLYQIELKKSFEIISDLKVKIKTSSEKTSSSVLSTQAKIN